MSPGPPDRWLPYLAPAAPHSREELHVTEITDEYMTLAIDDKVIATARFSHYAAADSNGAWMVSCLSSRLLTRDQAITALTVAELLRNRVPRR